MINNYGARVFMSSKIGSGGVEIILAKMTLYVIITRMITRLAKADILELLAEFPAVGILGPRQVGKTTLAEEVASGISPQPIYLDLEDPTDLAKLADPVAYFGSHADKLILLDEIQRAPGLFEVLRGVIDRRRRLGKRVGQFLVLGSASLDLLRQSSESLAGRIAYKQLTGLTVGEVKESEQDRLWLRGGFPDSFLAGSAVASLRWRMNFIGTYLERDVPQFGSRIPAVTLRRLWTMLAHNQGEQLNVAKLAVGLDISVPTAQAYIELLEDLLLVRTLRPWSGNVKKRLVKAPKVYIRDSGLTHAAAEFGDIGRCAGASSCGGELGGVCVGEYSVGYSGWSDAVVLPDIRGGGD